MVRQQCGRTLAEVRKKLEAAAEAGRQAPHKHIGTRLREALAVVLKQKEPEKVSQPMLCVERFTRVSRNCCKASARGAKEAPLPPFMPPPIGSQPSLGPSLDVCHNAPRKPSPLHPLPF